MGNDHVAMVVMFGGDARFLLVALPRQQIDKDIQAARARGPGPANNWPKLKSTPMQDDFVSLFAFNKWANARMLDACRKLTPEQYAAEPVPGWGSVRSSVYHIAVVTEGWLRPWPRTQTRASPRRQRFQEWRTRLAS